MTTTMEGPAEAIEAEVAVAPERSPRPRGRAYRWLSRNRRPFFVAHKWLSIVLLVWIVVECVTGSALVFRADIDRWWHAEDFHATDGDIGVGAAADSALAVHENAILNDVQVPDAREAGGMYLVGIYDEEGVYRRVVVDPGSGDVTNADYASPWLVQELADLHFNLNNSSVLGIPAIEAQAWLGVAFLISMLSGFYVWYWPRMRAWGQLLKVRRGLGRYRWHLDLHNAIGVVTLVPLLLITITGINFAFPRQVSAVYDVITLGAYDRDGTEDVAVSEPNGQEAIGLERATEIVEDLGVVDVEFATSTGGSPVGTYEVGGYIDSAALGMVGGERYVDVHIDQYTGSILEVHDPADGSGVQRGLDEWANAVHFGSFGGLLVQVLWVLVGLGPLVLAVTGVVMWVNRHNVRKGRAPAAVPGGEA